MDDMNIVAWAAVGIWAGLLAQFLLRDKWAGGLVGNLVVGAMGAVVAGWVMMRLVMQPQTPGLDVGNLIFAFLGAAGLLWVGRAVGAKKAPRHHRRTPLAHARAVVTPMETPKATVEAKASSKVAGDRPPTG